MSRTVYVNGKFVAEEDATVSIFDRGFLFADSVYEVVTVMKGKLISFDAHMQRLASSLTQLTITHPSDASEIKKIQQQLVTRNQLDEGMIYLQVTRGQADRDFTYSDDLVPSLVMFTQASVVILNPKGATGITVVSRPDIRWQNCNIKTVSLLPAVMAKQFARNHSADDVWFTKGEIITEGGSSNAYIVDSDDVILTHPLDNTILPGITRSSVIDLAIKEGFRVEQRAFSTDEVRQASEAFISSASNLVMAVVKFDDHLIGNGKPGPVTTRLRQLYIDAALAGEL